MSTVKKRLTENAERVNPVAPVHIWRSPAGSAIEVLVVTHLSAYSTIHEHATHALPNETGGFLIGRVAYDHRDGCWHLEIEEAVPVEPESQNPVHFTFTWRDVDRVRSYREEHNKAVMGWYHTHPGIGIFLSETDLERTHRVLFSEPFQVALVYDPVRGRAGYFFWEGAQTIDASQASWREFDIAVASEPGDSTASMVEPLPNVPTAPPESLEAGGTSRMNAGQAMIASVDPAAPAERLTTPHEGEQNGPAPLAISVPETSNPRSDEPDRRRSASESESPSDTQRLRRAIAVEADDSHALAQSNTDDTSIPGVVGNSVTASVQGEPARRGVGRVARVLWAVLGCVLLVIAGLAVGYFLFAPGRGTP